MSFDYTFDLLRTAIERHFRDQTFCMDPATAFVIHLEAIQKMMVDGRLIEAFFALQSINETLNFHKIGKEKFNDYQR